MLLENMNQNRTRAYDLQFQRNVSGANMDLSLCIKNCFFETAVFVLCLPPYDFIILKFAKKKKIAAFLKRHAVSNKLLTIFESLPEIMPWELTSF
jgi:hypothetical protein